MNATETVQSEIFSGFNPDSKIWIYASDRLLNEGEISEINFHLEEFTKQWVSHNVSLKAKGKVFYRRFIVLAVDESVEHPGGCSIDKSVHFIQSLERQFGIKLFDRLTVFYTSQNEMKSFHISDLPRKISEGEVTENTLIFDTTLTQLNSFRSGFLKEANKSWLSKFMS